MVANDADRATAEARSFRGQSEALQDQRRVDRGIEEPFELAIILRVAAQLADQLEARCRCSRERIEGILRLFSPDELDEMRQEGVTTVTCEFCNQSYIFDEGDLDRIRAT